MGAEHVLNIKALWGAALIALGITVPMPEFLGGMALCVGFAYLAFIVSPPAEKWSIRVTVAAAVGVGFLIALAHDNLGWLSGFSLHLCMAAGGMLSRPIILGFQAFGAGAVKRAGDVPGAVRFPWEKGNDQ